MEKVEKTVRVNIKAPTASGNRKGWYKHVTGVDASKTNGYAFEGDFLNEGLHDLPVGAILVCKRPRGSVKHPVDYGSVERVEADGSLTIIEDSIEWRREFLELRDAVAAALDDAAESTEQDTPETNPEQRVRELARIIVDHIEAGLIDPFSDQPDELARLKKEAGYE